MSFIDSFRKSLFYFLRRKTYAKTLERAQLYRLINSVELIRSYQVDRFNDIWQDAYTNIPFYKEWKLKNTLPNTISSLDELSTWPIITKKELQANYDKLKRCDVEPSGYIATGGSTGEPLKLPTWGDNETGVSMWIGRSAYGIFPDSKTFMLWGHRHLYGKGVRREVNILRQKIKDSLSNRLRVSAYDLSIDKMKENFAEYQKYKPEFVIGFSSAVLAFVRINKKCKKCTYLTPPQAVMCTAGPLTESEREEISSFFSAPVCMEYGSAECGVMAYTNPVDNEYNVFWDTHLLQGYKDEWGECRNIVTKIVPLYVPLIRYDIGDYLEIADTELLSSVMRIKYVKGRPSELVRFKDKICFFGALVGDCVKQVEGVLSSQLHVYDDYLCIRVVADRHLTDLDRTAIKNKMSTVVDNLSAADVKVVQVEALDKSMAGKVVLVVYHQCNYSD